MASSDGKPVFVAVHGAWHQPEHLDLVKSLMEKDGYIVHAVRLPSVGYPGGDPGNAVELDTAAVVKAIEDVTSTGQDVIVLCHSYAGLPTSDAVATIMEDRRVAGKRDDQGKILRLVFMASYVPEKGASVQTEHGPAEDRNTDHLEFSETGMLTNKYPVQIFYNTTPVDIANDAASKLLPIAMSAFLQTTKYCGWKDYDIPLAYIACKQDHPIPNQMQEVYIERCRAAYQRTEVWWLDCDHSPFLCMPEKVAQVLKTL